MMKFMLNLNVEKQINLLNNPHKFFDFISNTTVCEDSSIISLADDGGIELRNYDIVIIRFNSKIVGFVIVRSVKIVLLIFIIVQVLYVIFDLVLIILLLLLIVKLVIMMYV